MKRCLLVACRPAIGASLFVILQEASETSAAAPKGSPRQQVGDFYEAFGIRAGDPMWLDESKRVVIW